MDLRRGSGLLFMFTLYCLQAFGQHNNNLALLFATMREYERTLLESDIDE